MDVVTGSFGYIGKYITAGLIRSGRQVRTITTHPNKPNPFGEQVQAYSYSFENPDRLTEALTGCEVLFNTYWVRFNYRDWSFDKALANTELLFDCAKRAGIKKIIHISVTNPSTTDALPYYKGKALQEKALIESGIAYTIVRPTLVFGKEDILVNNIAWTIRKFPVVPIFGSGDYRVQPVLVDDLASICVGYIDRDDGLTVDAIGPENYTYAEFIILIARALGRRVPLVMVPPRLGILLGKVIGMFVRDVVLTSDELQGLMVNKLTSDQAPNAETRFSDWLAANKEIIGMVYTSELKRHFFYK